jgi:homoserine/homoserine lactone efflux protein
MINPHLFLAFIAAVTILMLMPGPNVALIIANSMAHGTKYGLLTVAGTSSAMIVQLILVAAGMAGLLGTIGHWFGWLRWIGAGYLFYLGIMQWRAHSDDLTVIRAEAKAPRRIYLRALIVSLANPKTLLFLAAFLPQFIDEAQQLAGQVAMLSVSFLMIAVAMDSGWALLAARARGLLAGQGRLRQRLTGGILIGAAFGMAIIRDK